MIFILCQHRAGTAQALNREFKGDLLLSLILKRNAPTFCESMTSFAKTTINKRGNKKAATSQSERVRAAWSCITTGRFTFGWRMLSRIPNNLVASMVHNMSKWHSKLGKKIKKLECYQATCACSYTVVFHGEPTVTRKQQQSNQISARLHRNLNLCKIYRSLTTCGLPTFYKLFGTGTNCCRQLTH